MIEVSAPHLLQFGSAHRTTCSMRGRFSGNERRRPDAVCVRAFAVGVRGALWVLLLRPWRWVPLPQIAPAADRSAFHCAGPALECAVVAAALRALESSG